MKENDFDDIGKRLYKQEAEPPQDGFSKIRATLVPPATPTKTILMKNWWKPLVVLIPVVVYLTVNDTELNQNMSSTSLTNAVKAESSNQKETEGTTITKSTTAETKQTINAPKQQEPIRLSKKQYASTTKQAEIIPIEKEIVEEKKAVSIETSQQHIPTAVKHETEAIQASFIITQNPVADSIQQDSLLNELATADSLEKE